MCWVDFAFWIFLYFFNKDVSRKEFAARPLACIVRQFNHSAGWMLWQPASNKAKMLFESLSGIPPSKPDACSVQGINQMIDVYRIT